MQSKYDNLHKNVIFYALIYINDRIIVCYQVPSYTMYFMRYGVNKHSCMKPCCHRLSCMYDLSSV